MNRPTINCTDAHLVLSSKNHPSFVEIYTEHIVDVALHGLQVGPVVSRYPGPLEMKFESLGFVVCVLGLRFGVVDLGE